MHSLTTALVAAICTYMLVSAALSWLGGVKCQWCDRYGWKIRRNDSGLHSLYCSTHATQLDRMRREAHRTLNLHREAGEATPSPPPSSTSSSN